jgi:hypothetical protein
MKRIRILAICNAIFFLLHLVPAQLTQLKLLSGQTIGEVSDKYFTLFTPAGITFAIWGVIYLALAAFCIYHLVKAFKEDATHEANRAISRMGYLFIINSLATGLWTIAWVHEWLLVSVGLMLVQLVTLILIQLTVGIYNPKRSAASRWFTQFPLSIYFGWICIATVANISATLVGYGWHGFGLSPEFWTMLMLAVATGITIFVVLNRRNAFVGLVTIWAFYGIILKHKALGLASGSDIITTAWLCLALVALAVLFIVYRNMSQSKTALSVG